MKHEAYEGVTSRLEASTAHETQPLVISAKGGRFSLYISAQQSPKRATPRSRLAVGMLIGMIFLLIASTQPAAIALSIILIGIVFGMIAHRNEV